MPDGAQNLRRQIARGIKALRLLLEVNSLQLKRTDALDSFVVRFAGDPAESFVRAAVREDDVVVITGDASDQ